MGGSSSSEIAKLRANLRDRYKDCYAVLKELLQNADDAGATELHVATIELLNGAEHALLAGPLLIVVNNARFRLGVVLAAIGGGHVLFVARPSFRPLPTNLAAWREVAVGDSLRLSVRGRAWTLA